MLIFFDFSDNQKQPDYTPQGTNLAKPAHNAIYRGPKLHTKGHIFSNGATAPPKQIGAVPCYLSNSAIKTSSSAE